MTIAFRSPLVPSSVIIPANMSAFNIDFYAATEHELIAKLQRSIGCFNCQSIPASKTCGRCKVATYCNRECQEADWKSSKVTNHKFLCQRWCDNRHDYENKEIVPAPTCMRGCGYMDESEHLVAMKKRGDMFLNEVRRSADAGCVLGDVIHLTVYVEDCGPKIQLVGHCSYYNEMIDKLKKGGLMPGVAGVFLGNQEEKDLEVRDVILDTVDEGTAANHMLYPGKGHGGGNITMTSKRKVIDMLANFLERAQERGILVHSITYGRGLGWFSDRDKGVEGYQLGKDTQKSFDKFGHCNGKKHTIFWMDKTPD